MLRRRFLTSLSVLGICALSIMLSNSLVNRILYHIEDLFKKPVVLPPDHERAEVQLPSGGEAISVEKALNSRCTSDYDENPKKFHWGMFDRNKKLSLEQTKRILDLSKIPRFTAQKVEIQTKQNLLTFIVDKHASGIQRDWMMVESGILQQAVGLVCAALGVGMVFSNAGKDGRDISDEEYATITIKLDAMKASYNGSFWSSLPPSGTRLWETGTLPDPVRQGNKPLLSTLANLKTQEKGSKELNDQSISQLLWAARGRTPHFYKSRPWGMTIPTWGGEQNISSVYLVSRNSLSKYINWNKNRPAHELLECHKINNNLFQELLRPFSANQGLIVLGRNENYARAF